MEDSYDIIRVDSHEDAIVWKKLIIGSEFTIQKTSLMSKKLLLIGYPGQICEHERQIIINQYTTVKYYIVFMNVYFLFEALALDRFKSLTLVFR